MKISYVYIVECADETYYTGVTTDLDNRIKDHESGRYPNSYTARRLPVKLVYFTEFYSIEVAIEKEKQIKKWSKAKKLALIESRYEDLSNLAKKNFDK